MLDILPESSNFQGRCSPKASPPSKKTEYLGGDWNVAITGKPSNDITASGFITHKVNGHFALPLLSPSRPSWPSRARDSLLAHQAS